MKGVFFSNRVLFAFVLILSSFLARANSGFLLKGKLAGAKKGTMIYLIQDRTKDTIAEAKVKGGKFIMQGEVPDGTEYFYLRVDSAVSSKRSKEFLLVNDIQYLETSLNEWPKIELEGSQPHRDYLALVSMWTSFGEIKNEEDKAKKFEAARSFILQHKNSLYTPDLIRRMMREFTLDEVNKMYLALSDESKNSYFGELLTKDLDLANKRKNIRQATTMPGFSIQSLDGSVIDIKEAIGKNEFTLIDFWASWCKPCREEVPNLKEVYAQYRDKGFGIVGVALSDKKDNWKKAIEEDGSNWFHGWDSANQSYKIFDIPAIPGFALVDRQGKLISFNCSGSAIPEFGPSIRGEKLTNTIDSLLYLGQHDVNSIVPLKIGDVVPNIPLGRIAGKGYGEVLKISDFKGKLVILDFWSTSCAVCISEFPKLHMLQKKFGDRLAIVPVGFQVDKNNEIELFLQKNRGTKRGLDLISTVQNVGDSILLKYFPFFGLPHELWIDESGKLIGITDFRAITESNIAMVLSGAVPDFKVRKKRTGRVKDFKLLRSDVIAGCAITGSIDTLNGYLPSKLRISDDSSFLYYQGFNSTVREYYNIAYSDFFLKYGDFPVVRTLVDTSDAAFYKDWDVTNGMDNWQYYEFEKNNVFGFELKVPANIGLKSAYQYMIKSLDDLFGVKSDIQKRLRKCLVLVRRGSKDLLQTNRLAENSPPGESIEIKGDNDIQFLKKHLTALFSNSILIVDETKYTRNIQININTRDRNLPAIKKQLLRYGLDLVEAEREVEVLVLKRAGKDKLR